VAECKYEALGTILSTGQNKKEMKGMVTSLSNHVTPVVRILYLNFVFCSLFCSARD
jgi:hypothetical protein